MKLQSLILVCMLALGCADEKVSTICRRACARAQLCGLLPSSLGGGDDPLDNCRERCSLSDDNDKGVQAAVIECMQASEPPTHFESDWCEDRSQCAAAAGCLRGRLPGSTLGQASLTVQLATASGWTCPEGSGATLASVDCVAPPQGDKPSPRCEMDCVSTNCVDGESCSAACGSGDTTGFCGCTGGAQVGQMQVFVQRGPEREAVRQGTCFELFETSIVFANLAPGVVKVGVELVGSATPEAIQDEDAGELDALPALGPSFCRTLMTEKAVLMAGTRSDARIVVPPLDECGEFRACENSVEACGDGIDNDQDGYMDCSDLDCPCAHMELCGDNQDNDGDRRVDCADEDCFDTSTCRSSPLLTGPDASAATQQ